MRLVVIAISIFSFMMNSYQAQSQKDTLKLHKWQNRLLLVIAEDTTNINFQ